MEMIAFAAPTKPDRQLAPADVIRAAAELIRHHAGYTITYALSQTTTDINAALVSLQTVWGCPVDAWERIHFTDHEDGYDDGWHLAWHLDMAARNLAARNRVSAA